MRRVHIVSYHLLPHDDNNTPRGVRHTYYHIIMLLCILNDGLVLVFRTRSGRVIVFTVIFHSVYDYACVCLFVYGNIVTIVVGTVFGYLNTTLPTENRGELDDDYNYYYNNCYIMCSYIIMRGPRAAVTGTPPCSIRRGLLPSSFSNNYRRLEQHGRRLQSIVCCVCVCNPFVWRSFFSSSSDSDRF